MKFLSIEKEHSNVPIDVCKYRMANYTTQANVYSGIIPKSRLRDAGISETDFKFLFRLEVFRGGGYDTFSRPFHNLRSHDIGQKQASFSLSLLTQCSEFIRTTGIRATNGYWQMRGRVRNSARFVRCITGHHLILIRPLDF